VNRRERALLLLVTAAFLVGVGVFYYKRARLRRQAAASPVVVVRNATAGCSEDSAAFVRPLDLNRATPRELDGLPGIGMVLAGRIVEYRQRRGGFRSVGELRAVPGIGEKRYLALKDLVTVVATSDSGR